MVVALANAVGQEVGCWRWRWRVDVVDRVGEQRVAPGVVEGAGNEPENHCEQVRAGEELVENRVCLFESCKASRINPNVPQHAGTVGSAVLALLGS